MTEERKPADATCEQCGKVLSMTVAIGSMCRKCFNRNNYGTFVVGEPERKPRQIERTLAEGESIEFRNVDVLSICIVSRKKNADQTRIVATVIDKPEAKSYE